MVKFSEYSDKVTSIVSQSSSAAKKVRFDGLDVAAMTAHVRRTFLGRKLVNVYDEGSGTSGSGKGQYVFELANAPLSSLAPNTMIVRTGVNKNGSASKSKMLLMESGIRFHPTQYNHSDPTNDTPSNFAKTLKEHLHKLCLENVTQLGCLDCVVDFRFGNEKCGRHVILELYPRGDIVLTDCNYEILASSRNQRIGQNDREVAMKTKTYPVSSTTIRESVPENTAVNEEQIEVTGIDLSKIYSKDETQPTGIFGAKKRLRDFDGKEALQWVREEMKKHFDDLKQVKDEDTGEDKYLMLKTLLLRKGSGVHHYGPTLLEHCILCANLDPNLKLPEAAGNLESILTPPMLESLVSALKEEGSTVINVLISGRSQGYIFYKDKENGNSDSSMNQPDKLFENIQPYLFRQHSTQHYLFYPSFADAVDEFFEFTERQRLMSRNSLANKQAKKASGFSARSARDRRLFKRYGSLSKEDKVIVNDAIQEELKSVGGFSRYMMENAPDTYQQVSALRSPSPPVFDQRKKVLQQISPLPSSSPPVFDQKKKILQPISSCPAPQCNSAPEKKIEFQPLPVADQKKKTLSARRLIKRYGSLSSTDKVIVSGSMQKEVKSVMSETAKQSQSCQLPVRNYFRPITPSNASFKAKEVNKTSHDGNKQNAMTAPRNVNDFQSRSSNASCGQTMQTATGDKIANSTSHFSAEVIEPGDIKADLTKRQHEMSQDNNDFLARLKYFNMNGTEESQTSLDKIEASTQVNNFPTSLSDVISSEHKRLPSITEADEHERSG